MTAIVLCGGKGTRLSAVFDGPKCLVDVGGRPIVEHVLAWLAAHGVNRVVLCVGPFLHAFHGRFGETYAEVELFYLDDKFRRGTGPATFDAMQGYSGLFEHGALVPVVNGDTLLIGDLLAQRVSRVTGRDVVSGQTKTAHFVVRGAGYHASERDWNLDDIVYWPTVHNESLSFVDVGTPEGLACARDLVGTLQ